MYNPYDILPSPLTHLFSSSLKVAPVIETQYNPPANKIVNNISLTYPNSWPVAISIADRPHGINDRYLPLVFASLWIGSPQCRSARQVTAPAKNAYKR